MPFIESTNIGVFPSANRGDNYNLQARLTSEYNLTNIVNQLLDKDAFVITPKVSKDGEFAFNIHGYYFCIYNITTFLNKSDFTSATTIWAYIKIASAVNAIADTSEKVYYQLVDTSGEGGSPLDRDAGFTGVNFMSSQPADGDGIYMLQLLDKVGSSWVVHPESLIKFTTDSVHKSISIDDGTL